MSLFKKTCISLSFFAISQAADCRSVTCETMGSSGLTLMRGAGGVWYEQNNAPWRCASGKMELTGVDDISKPAVSAYQAPSMDSSLPSTMSVTGTTIMPGDKSPTSTGLISMCPDDLLSGESSKTYSISLHEDPMIKPTHSYSGPFLGSASSVNENYAQGPMESASTMESSKPANGLVSMVYYPNWVVYAREFPPESISAPHRFSHILYAFAAVSSSGEVSLSDPWADLSKAEEGHSSGPKGNIRRLKALKESNPNLKFILSVGGYGEGDELVSRNFSSLVNAPGGVERFAKTAVDLSVEHGFDGLDIDWEYPESEAEGQQFADLLRAVRAELDEVKAKERLLLCAAMSADVKKLAMLPLQEIARLELLDYWLLMGYDYAGSFGATAAHASNIFESDDPLKTPFSTDKAVKEFVKSSVPRERIVLGMPLYGHDFLQTSGLGSRFSGVSRGSWDEAGGFWDYKDPMLSEAGTVHIDEDLIASWRYNEQSQTLVSFDSPEVSKLKAKYILAEALGGAMWWQISMDKSSGSGESLIDSVLEIFGSLEHHT